MRCKKKLEIPFPCRSFMISIASPKANKSIPSLLNSNWILLNSKSFAKTRKISKSEYLHSKFLTFSFLRKFCEMATRAQKPLFFSKMWGSYFIYTHSSENSIIKKVNLLTGIKNFIIPQEVDLSKNDIDYDAPQYEWVIMGVIEIFFVKSISFVGHLSFTRD